MIQPEFYVITGPNGAGKSSFIRSRLNDFSDFEIIMTDVFKSRTEDVLKKAISLRKNIVFETVFNDSSFKNIVDNARIAGYKTSLIVLFLNSIEESVKRVTIRRLDQNGLDICKGNVEINFNENFRNVSFYHFYFGKAYFIYTGNKNQNINIMALIGLEIVNYVSNSNKYIQAFANYAFKNDRLSQKSFEIITSNKNFPIH